nr:MAG TPA: tail fiber assembly protein [Caudoviricetes sp.]
MKFIVDRTEAKQFEDGMKYIAIFDKDNKDWYEELKKFKTDTLKVMYNKETYLVLSTNIDATMIAPTMVGDVVEEIEYQEVKVNPNLYFVDGKVVELQNYETIKNGKIVFNRDKKIEEIKKELYDLRVERDIAPFEFEVDGVAYLQNNRSIDQSNLTRIVVMCQALKKTTFENWKFYTKENSEKYVNLTIQDMMKMANIMQEQTTKSMAAETLLTHNLKNLTDEELKKYNAKEEYEKAYKNM